MTRKCCYWGMDLPEMTRIRHTLTESATHHGRRKILTECNLCFLLVTELDSSAREKTTRKLPELYKSNQCTYLLQQNIFPTIFLFQSGWWFWFITRPSLFRGPITKINQSDCSFCGLIFSRYWTGHCPEWSRAITLEDFQSFWKNLPSHKGSFSLSSNSLPFFKHQSWVYT